MRSMPYSQFFGEMELTEEQTERRLRFALRFEESVLQAFSKVEMLQKFDELNKQELWQITDKLADDYRDIYNEIAELDEEMDEYIGWFAISVLSTILNYDDEYQTSYDRAVLIAENEANTSVNHAEYVEALANGCTTKTWVTMKDMNVRQTHHDIDNDTIPINGYFIVGGSMMRFPKDMNGINVTGQETVNCRCTITYQ